MPDRPLHHPVASRPQQDSPVESPRSSQASTVAVAGTSHSALPGQALLDQVNTQVYAPDLSTFKPSQTTMAQAALKRDVVGSFMQTPGYRQLTKQTEKALSEARFLQLPGKPELLGEDTAAQCMKTWGLSGPDADPETLDPDLYDLYQIGLPNLARVAALCRALRLQPNGLDAQSQGEIRQALRNLFAHGLTVCVPGVIQNIEEAWAAACHAANPPDLGGELARRTHEVASRIVSKHVRLLYGNTRYFATNEIHMVAAVKNAMAGSYGFERVNDRHALPGYANQLLQVSGSHLRQDLDRDTAPVEICSQLAGDLMTQMRGQLASSDVEGDYQRAELINTMAHKLSRQFVECSPYTIGQIDPELGIPTGLSLSKAPLAISLCQQAERQGLCPDLFEQHAEVPRAGSPALHLVKLAGLVCCKSKAPNPNSPSLNIPLLLDDLLPTASNWLKQEMARPTGPICLTTENLGYSALFEALQNSKGGVWESVWQSGEQFLVSDQANILLQVMAVSTPELQGVVEKTPPTEDALFQTLHYLAHVRPQIFGKLDQPAIEGWLTDFEARAKVAQVSVDVNRALSMTLYFHGLSRNVALVKAAIERGVTVRFPVGDARLGSNSLKFSIHGPQWVELVLKLAPSDQKTELLESMVRNVLDAHVIHNEGVQTELLDAMLKQGACMFKNQDTAWTNLLDATSQGGLNRADLRKLLNLTVRNGTAKWSLPALSLLFESVTQKKLGLDTLRNFLKSPSVLLAKYKNHSSNELEQAHALYKKAVHSLLQQQGLSALPVAFQMINCFRGKGFPDADPPAIKSALENAVNSGFTEVLRLASQARLVPAEQVPVLLHKIVVNEQLRDEDATLMASYLLVEHHEKSNFHAHWTMASKASHAGRYRLGGLLLEKLVGVDNLNKLNQDGYAPLHLCAIHNNHKLIRAIVRAGGNVNIKASDAHNQKTPLHYAFRENSEEARRVLIECRADTETLDSRGRRPGDDGGLLSRMRRLM